jgi:DNA polymerase bacteriophage-type
MFKVEGDWLYMRLPSGRRNAYYKPEIREGDYGEHLTFLGIDTYTRQWCRCSTYGGKLAQNATEGVARDLLVAAMFRLRAANYPLVLHVHDEPCAEVLEGFGSIEEVERLMCILPKWAAGLPIAAEGFRAKRYQKA